MSDQYYASSDDTGFTFTLLSGVVTGAILFFGHLLWNALSLYIIPGYNNWTIVCGVLTLSQAFLTSGSAAFKKKGVMHLLKLLCWRHINLKRRV